MTMTTDQRSGAGWACIRLSEGKSRDDLTAGQVDAGNLFGIVMEALEKDLPVEVPDPGAVPDGDADVDALVRQWDDERAAMRARLDHLDRDDLDALLFSHPVAGFMDPVQTLQLAIAHFDTHARQIDRLRGELAV